MQTVIVPIICHLIEYEEPQELIYKTARCFLTIMMHVIVSLLLLRDLTGRSKNCSKTGYFPCKKPFRPIFSLTTELGEPEGTNYIGRRGSPTNIVQVIKLFLYDLRGS